MHPRQPQQDTASGAGKTVGSEQSLSAGAGGKSGTDTQHGGNPPSDEPEHTGRGSICIDQGELRIPTVSDAGTRERLRRSNPAGTCSQCLAVARKDTAGHGGAASYCAQGSWIGHGTEKQIRAEEQGRIQGSPLFLCPVLVDLVFFAGLLRK